MKSTGLVVVLAHKGTFCGSNLLGESEREMSQETFDRHLPLWEHHGWPIVVVCPENAKVETKHEIVLVGNSSHSGTNGYLRIERVLELIVGCRAQWTIINEYDSFCLEPNPEIKRGLYGNLFPNYDRSQFISDRYPNPPWTLDFESAKIMLRAHTRFPDVQEGGFHDRVLAGLAYIAHIPLVSFYLKGMSNDTLLERDRAELERRILHYGACWIHGVKTKKALDVVLDLWNRRAK